MHYKLLLFLKVRIYLLIAFIIKPFLRRKVINEKSIIFLSAFFPENAGYHWRVKEWADMLQKNGYTVDIKQAIYKEEFYGLLGINQSLFLMKYLNRRFWQVISSRNYSIVVVRRELLLFNDYGNLFLDKLLLKIHPDAILDFDDDIAFAKKEPRNIDSLYGKLLLENGTKFTESISLYQNFMVGSNYLKNYVLERNKNISSDRIVIIPTCVNYDSYEPKTYQAEKKQITFGWVGGNHNLILLESIIEPLNKLSKSYDLELLVIAGKDYQHNKAKFKIRNKRWSLETEKEDIKSIDIGLMPLLNTNRDKGKAGFKLIQYMGLGVVSIASNVTVNAEIIDDGINGFLVDEDWESCFEEVLSNKEKFGEIGKLARKKINEHYSFRANLPKYLNFLQSV